MATFPVVVGSFSGDQATVGYARYSSTTSFGIPPGELKTAKIAAFTRVTFFSEESFGGRQLAATGPITIPDLTPSLGKGAASMIVVRVDPSTDTIKACCFGQLAAGSCGEFTPGGNSCAGALAKYCANPASLGDQNCRIWCANNPTVCDSAVMSYCATNPSDPYCGCITSQASVRGIVNPKCVDRKCLNGGYLTAAMQSGPCPSIISCDIKLNLENSGVEIGSTIPIQQNCGGSQNSTVTTTYAELSEADLENQVAQKKKVLLFIIILIVAVMGGIAFYVFVYDASPSAPPQLYYPPPPYYGQLR